MFFDDQFKFVGGNSSRVGTSGVVKDHWQDDPNLQNLTAPKNGYIFVYVSNESKLDVFFDNLQVIHKPGPILEETHYYPFGLTMAGSSSKALAFGNPQNRFKFNDGTELANKEFSDGSGLEIYETPFRGYDPQIGRFHQLDQLAEVSLDWSPFVFASNNPISRNDRLGLKDSLFKGENPNNKLLPEVVVHSSYTNKDYQKIITDNIHQKSPSLFDLLPLFLQYIRIVGFKPGSFAEGLEAMNRIIDL